MAGEEQPIIIIKKKKKGGGGHHGGAWKVAYADFVTAMMAFFMVMWLVATMPQEQLGGVAEFFKNPSAVRGRAAEMAPGSMGPGGAGNAPIEMFRAVRPGEGDGTTGRAEGGESDDEDTARGGNGEAEVDPEEARRIAQESDRRELEDLQQLLEEAIANSLALAPFKDQLLIDLTPEGLRIQIVDAQNRPMFDLGSTRLQPYTQEILGELATYLNRVDNRIALTGHTDIAPFIGGAAGYTNWELSAERANAARRALVAGGLEEEKVARVVGLSSSALFDRENPRNPINRRISIVVLNQAAEEAAARTDTPQDDAAPSAVDEAAAGSDLAPAAADGATPDPATPAGGATPGPIALPPVPAGEAAPAEAPADEAGDDAEVPPPATFSVLPED